MKKLVVGILAHVDAGKTTLSEAMLFESGAIRKMGRVDNKDAFLDNYEVERNRGITVFSKQAVFGLPDLQITLLDTPGHVDFSAEMERTLQVLDYAILVISGADGVQGHTRTLWRLLLRYNIPVFLFVNKMDQPGTDKIQLLQNLKDNLSENCVDFTGNGADGQETAFAEELAVCSEAALEQFLENGAVSVDLIKEMIRKRQVFPCFFGSALKMEGVRTFMEGVERYAVVKPQNGEERLGEKDGTRAEAKQREVFGARVFKITRDPQGNRLTHMKITAGRLRAKDLLKGGAHPDREEKVNQIRIYSGEKFEAVPEAGAGTVCAVTGLEYTRPGEGLGCETAEILPLLEPVLNYRIFLPEDCDAAVMLPKLRQIEEEEPQLRIEWNEQLQEIHVKVMGEVQTEILQGIIQERFGVRVTFGDGSIVYKETIADVVEGIGHFEPLRHYAEVHLILEPGERGSGLQFEAAVSEDELSRNWQRLIMTHLEEKQHKGVLTGSVLTDVKITLAAGRAHLKHTEGGDFRESTYRAVRQGLMQASIVLLEPHYRFRIEVPEQYIGRVMTDVERQFGKCELHSNENGMAVLTGSGPVQTMRNYQKEITAYTGGAGQFFGELGGYEPCHNTEEVMEQIGYDCDSDLRNPSGSVFCAHGAGFVVPWDEVYDYMHLEKRLGMRGTRWAKYGERYDAEGEDTFLGSDTENGAERSLGSVGNPGAVRLAAERAKGEEIWLGTEEIDAILDKTYNANRRGEVRSNKWARSKPAPAAPAVRNYTPGGKRPQYLLVDGYNIIFAWDDLKELAATTIDGARGKLQDILCNYQGLKKCEVILVFDAYRVQGHKTEIFDYHNIHVVYTQTAETADQYIEKFAHENGRKYDVTVATSDGLEQIIIQGQGCHLLSARELRAEIGHVEETVQKEYLKNQERGRNLLGEVMPKIDLQEE